MVLCVQNDQLCVGFGRVCHTADAANCGLTAYALPDPASSEVTSTAHSCQALGGRGPADTGLPERVHLAGTAVRRDAAARRRAALARSRNTATTAAVTAAPTAITVICQPGMPPTTMV
jgi:hypothetical protein